jgi:pSer/pThr/pTyr-binding forkhead associated (FHA) protein
VLSPTALDLAAGHPDVVAALLGNGSRPAALHSEDLATPRQVGWLAYVDRNGCGVAAPVTPPGVAIGTDRAECDVVLPSDGVGSVRARVDIHPGGWPVLTDLGSKGGCRINGMPVAQAPITMGDCLELGGFELQLVDRLPLQSGGRSKAARGEYGRSASGPGVTLEQKLAWIDSLCAEVAAEHARGVVNGDLEYHRIRLQAEGRVELDLSPKGTHLPGASPEQLRGQPADTRSDVFAAASLAYHIVTGRQPSGGIQVLADQPPHALECRESSYA